jgi:hypothetical protein
MEIIEDFFCGWGGESSIKDAEKGPGYPSLYFLLNGRKEGGGGAIDILANRCSESCFV